VVKEEELEIQPVAPAKAMLQGKSVLLPSPNPALKPLKKLLKAIAEVYCAAVLFKLNLLR
jgi:hypothetical protein